MVIAESVVAAAARYMVAPVLKKLIEEGIPYVGMIVPCELEDFEEKILPQLLIAMKASEITTDIGGLEPWLQRLKKTYDEAEDILDMIEYEKIANKVNLENREIMVRITSLPLIKSLTDSTDKDGRKFNFSSAKKRKLWLRINKLKKEVEDLANMAKAFHQSLAYKPNTATINQNAINNRKTTSIPPENKFIVRSEEYMCIVNFLLVEPHLLNSKMSYPVGAILGRGGLGKTTLARHVYNDFRVHNHFGTRIWVSLEGKLEVTQHTKAMIESASLGKDCAQQSTLEGLQSILMEKLSKSERTLLLLDDVWYNNNQKVDEDREWEKLFAPLSSTKGLKVLLTSCSSSLPRVLETKYRITLKELSHGDRISLFRHYAYLDDIESPDEALQVKELSEKIVEELSNPLQIQTVAAQLKGRGIHQWRKALEFGLGASNRAFLWCFHQLNEALQQCFLFCSIFPKGYQFKTDELCHMWLALNYVRSSDTNATAKDVALEYFMELISVYMFQPADEIQSCYIIPNEFHYLLERLTKGECFRIEDSQTVGVPPTVRHLSIAVRDIEGHVPSICNLKRLRTLIFLQPIEEDSITNLDKILRKLKRLRILVLNLSSSITELPKSTGNLKYLRYLNFFRSAINQVPESLSKLHLLYILILPFSLGSLPVFMSNFLNLRHVHVIDNKDGRHCAFPPARQLGKNTSLQTLPAFYVRKEKGYELKQLGNLREIQGHLQIFGLENVSHKDEAVGAKLNDKNLEGLELWWSTDDATKRVSDFEIIEALEPPNHLKFLVIYGYAGKEYPKWFDGLSESICLLRLIRSNALQALPPNIHSWKFCQEIVLNELVNLEKLPTFPVQLRRLVILGCPSLVLMFEKDLQSKGVLLEKEFVLSKVSTFNEPFNEGSSGISGFNSIGHDQKLVMHNECDMFQHMKLIDRPNELEILRCVALDSRSLSLNEEQLQAWWDCHQERVTFMYSRVRQKLDLPNTLIKLEISYCNITDEALSNCLRNLPLLVYLHLEGLMSLTTLPFEEAMLELRSLLVVEINSCWLLRSLGALHKLCNLRTLEIIYCPCLELESENNESPLPTSLERFYVRRCTISRGTLNREFRSLEYVHIESCRSSEIILLGTLTTVTDLNIVNCPDICSLSKLHMICKSARLRLTLVPKLQAIDHLYSWFHCIKEFHTDNLEMLKSLSSETLVPPKFLVLELLKEEKFTFCEQLHLESVEGLYFSHCNFKTMPPNCFSNLSSLKVISFQHCPEISKLPELPQSLELIQIISCPMLKKRYHYNGKDWKKIAGIKFKSIV